MALNTTPVRALSTSGARSLPVCGQKVDFRSVEAVTPSTPEQVVAMLTSCLTLVRPVGMTDQDAGNWLHTSSEAVRHVPFDLLVEGCTKAKLVCDHHAKIVPTIAAEVKDRLDQRLRYHGGRSKLEIDHSRQPRPAWAPTPDEIEAIHAQAAARLRSDR